MYFPLQVPAAETVIPAEYSSKDIDTSHTDEESDFKDDDTPLPLAFLKEKEEELMDLQKEMEKVLKFTPPNNFRIETTPKGGEKPHKFICSAFMHHLQEVSAFLF